MPDRDDQSYFLKRAQRERVLASSSSDCGVALTHAKMADEYERRAAGRTETIRVTAIRVS